MLNQVQHYGVLRCRKPIRVAPPNNLKHMTRKQITLIIIIAFFIGAVGSIAFNRAIIPFLSRIPKLSFLSKLSSNAPIVIIRREEIRLNEGVNLIELTKQAQGFTVSIYSADAAKYLGNGIIVANDGLIFTSKEVVDSQNNVQVVLNDGKVFPGLLRALDPQSEVAVITIPANALSVAAFADASNLQTAQRVLALGKTSQVFTRKFASGLITKTVNNDLNPNQIYSSEAFNQSISTDAQINADFVGGPVIDLEGRMIGIVVNYNGKILISEIVSGALKSYLEQGKIARPYFGLKYLSITKPLANLRKINPGALVVEVEKGSPAEKSGLLKNDLVVEVNGQKVEDSSLELLLLKNNLKEIRLSILRGETRLELALVPGQK